MFDTIPFAPSGHYYEPFSTQQTPLLPAYHIHTCSLSPVKAFSLPTTFRCVHLVLWRHYHCLPHSYMFTLWGVEKCALPLWWHFHKKLISWMAAYSLCYIRKCTLILKKNTSSAYSPLQSNQQCYYVPDHCVIVTNVSEGVALHKDHYLAPVVSKESHPS